MFSSGGHGIPKRGDKSGGLTGASGARGHDEDSAFYGKNNNKYGANSGSGAIGGAYDGEREGTSHFGAQR